MSQEDYWDRRKRAIRRGAQQGGAAGARAAEKAFNAGERGWTHIKGSVEMTKQKAKGIGEIVCGCPPIGAIFRAFNTGGKIGEKSRGCPKHPEGHRYRGKNKCWGCGHATWYSTDKPYR